MTATPDHGANGGAKRGCPPTWRLTRSARCIGCADRVVIGQREEDLAAVELDFAANPLLLVLGDTKSGNRPRYCATSSALSATTRRRTASRPPCLIAGCISSTSRCSPTTNTPPTSTG